MADGSVLGVSFDRIHWLGLQSTIQHSVSSMGQDAQSFPQALTVISSPRNRTRSHSSPMERPRAWVIAPHGPPANCRKIRISRTAPCRITRPAVIGKTRNTTFHNIRASSLCQMATLMISTHTRYLQTLIHMPTAHTYHCRPFHHHPAMPLIAGLTWPPWSNDNRRLLSQAV